MLHYVLAYRYYSPNFYFGIMYVDSSTAALLCCKSRALTASLRGEGRSILYILEVLDSVGES